jgi:hypothetical protein
VRKIYSKIFLKQKNRLRAIFYLTSA